MYSSVRGVATVVHVLLLVLYFFYIFCTHSLLPGDSVVMVQRGRTFAAADERRGAAAALEMAVARLKTLEWRIGFIRRGVREPEG